MTPAPEELRAVQADHTPTPWVELDDGHGTSRKLFGGEHRHQLGTIHSYWTGPGPGQAERNANAAFIVRAVNAHEALVEALHNARVQLRALGGVPGDDPNGDTIQRAVLVQVDEALALAEATLNV